MAQGDGLRQVHAHRALGVRPQSLDSDCLGSNSCIRGCFSGRFGRSHSDTVAERRTAANQLGYRATQTIMEVGEIRSTRGTATDSEPPREWAWSAWSIWRGDLQLLARAARVAFLAVGGDGAGATLTIEVTARDDREEFDSVEGFIEQVTPQAMRRFTQLTIRAETAECGVEVLMARKKVAGFPFGDTRGLVIQAWARSADSDAACEAAEAICDQLRVTLRRGSLPWTRGLRETETTSRDGIKSSLSWLNHRRTLMTMTIVVILASVPFYAILAILSLDVVEIKDVDGAVTAAVAAQVLILAIGLPAARFVMPSIEVAELTPGRRMARLLGRSGLVTGLAGLLLAFLKGKAGLAG